MNLDSFTLKWYDKSVSELKNTFNLLSIENSGLRGYKENLLSDKNVVGVTDNLEYVLKKDAYVCGGPCIDDCKCDISIESVFDIITLIKVGKILNKKVIIHIGVEEEILRNKQSQNSKAQWVIVGNKFEKIIKKLSFLMKHEVICVRSDNPFVNKNIEFFTKKIELILNENDAVTLYQHLLQVKPKIKDSFNFRIHLRFLSLYLPEFIDSILERKGSNLIIYENLQQLMAAKKGRAIATLWNNYNNGPYQIVSLSYPSTDGLIRMHRFDKEKKPYLHDSDAKLFSYVDSMALEVFEFNKTAWPTEISGEINNRTDLKRLLKNLKVVLDD